MLRKGQLPIFLVNALAIAVFTAIFIIHKNLEFMVYVAVIVFFLFLILLTDKKVEYPNSLLWGLTFWAFLHMAGGGIFIGGERLYSIIVIPLVGDPYFILKFDQVVHVVGFFISTLLVHHLLKPSLVDVKRRVALSIVLVMGGLGLGAMNEIIEFMATVIFEKTGVGGYENTALDLVADLVGALLALPVIWKKK